MEIPLASQILSDITTHMKYAKYLSELRRRETWEETVDRNKAMHIAKFPELAEEIEQAYTYVYDKKILASMRCLQFSGKPIELNPARLYNCSAVHIDHIDVFSETMFLLLSGAGVGYSCQRHHVRKLPPILGVQRPEGRQRKKRYLIGDSIEGWADAVKVLITSYFYNKREIDFDFRDIRAKGSLLVTSGGRAPGPEPLRNCLDQIKSILENAIATRGRATKLKPIEAHDIQCHIADAVLSGGIRRAAMLCLFSLEDTEMLESKFGAWYELNPQRALANNSVMLLRSQIDEEVFMHLWKKIEASGSGEPGIFLSNSEEWIANPCFTGDMKLLTDKGYKSFYSLSKLKKVNIITKKGMDYVYKQPSIDDIVESTGKVWCSGEKVVYEYVFTELFDNGMPHVTNDIILKCTPDHKIAVLSQDIGNNSIYNSWKKACDITPYDYINLGSGGKQRIGRLIKAKKIGVKKVYDFSEPIYNYGFVNGVCVHNCNEVSLRSTQMCNLVEINFSTVESQDDLNLRAKYASFIATLQATYTDFHYLREEWKDTTEKEALIGVSLTGVATDKLYMYDIKQASKIVVKENRRVAKLVGINASSRSCVIKPSGTASIVLGTSSGVHAWYDEYYWRRIRVSKNEAIYRYLSTIHPELIEEDMLKSDTTAIIKVPQKAPDGAILRSESPIDTLERVKYLHENWIKPAHKKGINKNNVSCTINVKNDEWGVVGRWMWENKDHYNGIAVLPYDNGTYIQPPFESCTKEEYEEAMKHLTKVDLQYIVEEIDNTDLQGEVACGGGACEVV